MIKLNNKGFTLVEVLAVIIILGILASIMVPNTVKLIEKNKSDNDDRLEESIIAAAKMYVSDNRDTITTTQEITIQKLVDAGYLSTNKDGNIIQPSTKKTINKTSSKITVTFDTNKKSFTYNKDNITIITD